MLLRESLSVERMRQTKVVDEELKECQGMSDKAIHLFSDLAGGKSLSLCGGPPQLHGDTGVGWPTYFQKIIFLHIGCSWQVLVFREDGEQGAEECAAR